MSIKDLINQAYNKDATGFETTFNSIMGEKMSGAIEAKYDEMFGAQEVEVEEEVEIDSDESVDEGYKKKMKESDEEADDDEDEEEEDEDEDED